MQFVQRGPDVPEILLQAHEDGRVVFFCGAGISYPAGLPGFRGLVNNVYSAVGTSRTAIEEQAFGLHQYDATLDLLERRIPGQRAAVRAVLPTVLRPKYRRSGATDTHASLLQLGRARDGAVRLVTTNFDRVFERVIARQKLKVPTFSAPLLPIPKSSRWDGLVYLHGLMPAEPNESALNRLVITSGDFGLAYLTERWAARFVSELFRNYVVCFVGYSINDPVLRYMMDALAADRMLGEVTLQAYAFGDFEPGQEDAKRVEWEAKGVTPVLYEVGSRKKTRHLALHNTLRVWSEIYRDGVQGKERIVVDYAATQPSASTKQDDFVGRLLWAISHESGLPAKRFAEFEPAPSLDWLDAFEEPRYRHGDLHRFGVPPLVRPDEKLEFSLIRRPSPYTLAPRMAVTLRGNGSSGWDSVMFYLARWLVRHLDDPKLLLWLAQHGGSLHDRLSIFIEHQLDNLAELERQGNTLELSRIRANAPSAIPRPLMCTLWRLLLTERVKSPWKDADLFRWKSRLRRDGYSAALRLELRELLAPMIRLKKPFRWGDETPEADEPLTIKRLVDWELVLTADDALGSLKNVVQSPTLRPHLPRLLGDVQQLLCDALDLRRELGGADDRNDNSIWDQPSISEHWQNRRFHDWVALIELLRDSWLLVVQDDQALAWQIARNWSSLSYSTFKRLALFAATHIGIALRGEWVDWLLAQEAWWLWSHETQRETMRLLVLRGAHLPPEAKGRLEAAILQGPPRAMFGDGLEPESFARYSEDMILLRLGKLESSGATLGADAHAKLRSLREIHPDWRVASNERDEFPRWMSGTGDPDYEDRREFNQAPRTRRDLVDWLRRPIPQRIFYVDNWRETCRERFNHCVFALCDLSKEGQWPAARWREALQAWTDEKYLLRSWKFVAPLVKAMPFESLAEMVGDVSWWLEDASKGLEHHTQIFLDLCDRILALAVDEDDNRSTDLITEAINNPVGHITQALVNFWFRREPNDDDGLPDDLRSTLTRLCDTEVKRYRYGRLVLASHLIALFRVDKAWTGRHLIPLFNWESSKEDARVSWQGFLRSPRIYRPLLIAIKGDFLATAHHYANLNQLARQYAAFLTYIALEPADTFTNAELRVAFSALGTDGLSEAARTLVHALEAAGEQREPYWTNRVSPFWRDVWPKSLHLASKSVSENLARLTIAARGKFPEALIAVQDWLQPPDHPHFIVHLLDEAKLCGQFPKEALRLLDAIVQEQPWPLKELVHCLRDIAQAWPKAEQEASYRRLIEYARLHPE